MLTNQIIPADQRESTVEYINTILCMSADLDIPWSEKVFEAAKALEEAFFDLGKGVPTSDPCYNVDRRITGLNKLCAIWSTGFGGIFQVTETDGHLVMTHHDEDVNAVFVGTWQECNDWIKAQKA